MLKKRETTLKKILPKTLPNQKSCGKPWKQLPNKVSIATINALKDNKVVKYDPKSISKVFQTFFSNMVKTLLQKLTLGIDSVNKLI